MIFTELTFTVYQVLGGLDGKESACSVGDLGSIPGLGRSSGEGNGYPLQYSCLENPMDRGAWGLQSMGLQSDTIERLTTHGSLPLEPLGKPFLCLLESYSPGLEVSGRQPKTGKSDSRGGWNMHFQ